MDFRILGPVEVRAGDDLVPLGGAKPRAVLAILLLHANEVVSNERLIDALWGERPPDTAVKALQVHVSQLRKAIGASALQTRAPGYVLEVDDDDLDLHRFQRLREEARAALAGDPQEARRLLGRALDLWRGPPLADFAYEPFAQADIGRLEEMRAEALEDRVEADLALGRHSALVGELESSIAQHPHRERLRAQLMLALYRSGRQAEALDAYRDARRALTDELGIEPTRELRELQEAILRQDPGLDATEPSSAAATEDPSRGPFVGRERELALLHAALEGAMGGDGRVALIAGEPGIGKSRLADELLRDAGQRGARVLVGRCWEAGGAPPYWPWVQALRAYMHEADPDALRSHAGGHAADLAAVLPELRELLPDVPAPGPDSEGARFRLMEAVSSFLQGAASDDPIAIFLDDLHAADAASLLLLRFVARQLGASRILIVGCYRDTEAGEELVEALAELAREPAVHRTSLRGLSGPDTSRLLEQTMGASPARELAERVQAETQGNPLFATEIGRLLASEDPGDGGRLPIPEGVREAIGRRLQRQSQACREVLALGSVIGREFDPEVVARMTDMREAELFEALDEAAAARLVGAAPESSGHLRFSHILVRDVLYEDLPAPRRPRLHRAVAEALEELYAANAEPHLAELAHHYLEAGPAVAGKALDHARRAGDRAASQHGYEEAARHYATALGVLERGASAGPEETCDLLLSLGESLSRAGSGQEAQEALLRAAELARRTGRADQLARAALEFGGRFAWARASTDAGLAPLLESALEAVGDEDSPDRVRLLARLAAASRDDALRDRRLAMADEAVAIAERIGDPSVVAFAREGHYVASEGPHDADRGLDVGAELIAFGRRVGDQERVFGGHDYRLHAYFWLADRDGVDRELEAMAQLAEELRQPPQRWAVGTGRTTLALVEGRFEDAERLIATTVAVGRRAQSWNALVSQLLALFVLRRAQGRVAEVEDAIAAFARGHSAQVRFACAMANLHAELGREREARAALADVLTHDLEREHLDAEWLFSMSVLADPCAYLGDRDTAEWLHALLLPHERRYAEAPVEAAYGCVARPLGVLAATLRRFDDAERHFQVAIETERRMRARPWLAETQMDYAAMLLERAGPGDAERAEALRAEALATCRELGMRSRFRDGTSGDDQDAHDASRRRDAR